MDVLGVIIRRLKKKALKNLCNLVLSGGEKTLNYVNSIIVFVTMSTKKNNISKINISHLHKRR